MEEETTVMTTPGPKPEPPAQQSAPETPTEAKPDEPAYIPPPPEGPAADMFSDEPDSVVKPGGAGGNDTFGLIS
ncbi:MAG: hypothetical protein IMF05_03195 [Proteobacteria bacterium]|nr:hypothetical protein [Pseudomonadota bacterium]